MTEVPHRIVKIILLLAASAVAVLPLLSQAPATKKPSFEITSVKATPPASAVLRGGAARGNRFTMTGTTLRMLLQYAYRHLTPPGMPSPTLMSNQIIGGPAWIDTDRFDVEAKAEGDDQAIAQEKMQLMVQSLLEERFQLKARLETRDLPVYNLMAGKDGPKIKRSEDQTPTIPSGQAPPGQRGAPFDPRAPSRGSIMIGAGASKMTLGGTAVPISTLATMLQTPLSRPVIDKTDLKGLFDFKIEFSAEGMVSPFAAAGVPAQSGQGAGGVQVAPAADPLGSLFTVIQELGLRLESTKGPVDVLVIESVQKPTDN
jgi:uncharacterized protein (TIGR03435 family)